MRSLPLVITACATLLACGGSGSSQASNGSGNAAAKPGATVSAAASAIAAPVSGAAAAAVMHERHDAMEGLGKSMKTLHRALDASPPDINAIRAQTSSMAATAAKIPALFPRGTGPDAGKTRARPEIWTQQKLFAQKSRDFLVAARAIDAAAKSGDLNKVMGLHDSLDHACKACHDPFRAPEH